MALEISNQYLYTGRGPFDAKLLVKTYADLKKQETWNSAGGKSAAYNGMIVAVWCNKDDTTKNGIYYLHDSAVTTTFKDPDVTNEANWHKIGENSDISAMLERLQSIEATVNGTDTVTGLVSKVEDNTTAIGEIKADYVKAEDLATYAKTEDVVTTEAFNEFKTSNDEAILAIASTVSGKADLVALNDYYKTIDADNKFATKENADKIAEIANANSAKLNGITTTVVQAIEDAVNALPVLEVEVATSEKLGGIKSASGDNKVSVDNDGTASVTKININTLVQNKGDILVLDSGSSQE
jgi:hypothetical protein